MNRDNSPCEYRKRCYRFSKDCDDQKYVDACESREMCAGNGIRIDGEFILSPEKRRRNKRILEEEFEEIRRRHEVTTKTCVKCGRELPLAEFAIQHRNKDGLNCKCRDCIAEERYERLAKQKQGKKRRA